MRLPAVALAALALLAGGWPLQAATLAATPDTLGAQLDAAQPGDVVKLSGDFDVVTLKGRKLTIDARRAHLAGFVAYDSDFTLKGGTFTPPDGKVGIMVRGGAGRLQRVAVAGGLNSVVFLMTDRALLTGSNLSGYAGDGVHVFGAKHTRILRNRIVGGVNDGVHHPDPIQFHNLPDRQVEDVLVADNDIDSPGQGIDNFDDPTDAFGGAMKRLVIRRNTLAIAAARAITTGPCEACEVSLNTVTLRPDANFRTTQVTVGPDVTVTGNVLGEGVKLVVRPAPAP